MTNDQTTSAEKLDIDKQRLGVVYATGLLRATEAKQTSDEVMEELDTLIDELFVKSPELETTLATPRIAVHDKQALLDRVFEGKVSEQFLTFLKVVARHSRLDCIRDIRVAFRNELNRLRAKLGVIVTSAAPISDDQRGHVVHTLQTKMSRELDVTFEVDPEIIGGLVIKVGDTVYDSSVASQLNGLREDTVNKTISQMRDSIDRFAVSG